MAERFRGFAAPNYVQIPNSLIDQVMPKVSDREFKLLIWLAARTFGFRRGPRAVVVHEEAGNLEGWIGLGEAEVRDAMEGLVAMEVVGYDVSTDAMWLLVEEQ